MSFGADSADIHQLIDIVVDFARIKALPNIINSVKKI
jgi:hypothetical protein